MNDFILFDDDGRNLLLPFTFTRPCSEIRTGILTITEKWELRLKGKASFITEEYLQEKFPASAKAVLFINGRFVANNEDVAKINLLKEGEGLWCDNLLLAYKKNSNENIANYSQLHQSASVNKVESAAVNMLDEVWQIFKNNHQQIENDFQLLTSNRKSAPIPASAFVNDATKIFIEEGAQIDFAFFNTNDGPIYIGENAHVMEGAMIRGPFALCHDSEVKMGAKIYTGTTIGPHCKVGGEVNNSVIFGFSNKAHDGFLGNSVIGEWCNLGADTNNSNLKNDYSEVKLWNYADQKFKGTGLQFCGLIMGDHSKCGINTMFNTGTVVGVFCNVFGDGFPRNYIPNFSWGGAAGQTGYQISKALKVAEAVMQRRGLPLTETDIKLLTYISENFKN